MRTITPQAIKDQEFLAKFRGYDTVEVKAYLETIAEEFFALQQKCRDQDEEFADFQDKVAELEEQNKALTTDMQFTRKISEELKKSSREKEDKVIDMAREVEELQTRIADFDAEKTDFEEEISAATAKVDEARRQVMAERNIAENLKNKVELLEKQNTELKKEEVDFKATLASAQKFAAKLKQNSQVEAKQMVEEAKKEIRELRYAAHAELSRLPEEIDELRQKRDNARSELQKTLESYLTYLDTFVAENEGEKTTELFQKISIMEDGSLDPDDVQKAGLNDKELDPESIFSEGLGSLELSGNSSKS